MWYFCIYVVSPAVKDRKNVEKVLAFYGVNPKNLWPTNA